MNGRFDLFAWFRRRPAPVRWAHAGAAPRRANGYRNVLALFGWGRPPAQSWGRAKPRRRPDPAERPNRGAGYDATPVLPQHDLPPYRLPQQGLPPDDFDLEPLSHEHRDPVRDPVERGDWNEPDGAGLDQPSPDVARAMEAREHRWDDDGDLAQPDEVLAQPDDVVVPSIARTPTWDTPGDDSAEAERSGWGEAGHEPRWNQAPGDQGFLAVRGVEKSFAGRKVVKGVSLHLRRGEAVGLLGPNGAGKTTVFYMITGLVKADRGRIELDGHDITGLPMYQHGRLGIGYLPQEASIFRGLSVENNIRAVLEQVEPSRRKREAELDALLDEFNITHLRRTPSIALSGGERRRVEIARSLATRPSYMLLDEPFAGIDPIAVGDIQALVRHLTQRGIGVLITDHNVRETLGLTDRAYIIYSGQVLMEGNTADIVNDPEVRRLYLGAEFRL